MRGLPSSGREGGCGYCPGSSGRSCSNSLEQSNTCKQRCLDYYQGDPPPQCLEKEEGGVGKGEDAKKRVCEHFKNIPPYSCKQSVPKPFFEALSLSFANTELFYLLVSGLVITLLERKNRLDGDKKEERKDPANSEEGQSSQEFHLLS